MTPRDRDPGKRCQPVFPEQADVSDLLPKKIRSVVGSFQQGPVRQHGIRGAGYADSHRRLCHAFDAFNHTVSSHLREVCLERSKTFVDAALHCFSEKRLLVLKVGVQTGSEMRARSARAAVVVPRSLVEANSAAAVSSNRSRRSAPGIRRGPTQPPLPSDHRQHARAESAPNSVSCQQ